MCNCIKEVEQKFKDNFGYEEVNGPVELLSGRAYLSFEVKETGKKKSKQVPMMLSKCPICGKEYAKKEDSKQSISDDNPWITEPPKSSEYGKIYMTVIPYTIPIVIRGSVENGAFYFANGRRVKERVTAWKYIRYPEPYKEVSEEC